MGNTDYNRMYEKIFRILGDLTPIRADCGQLCAKACCKGDENTGMRLFPYEESKLKLNGGRLAVCDGTCSRNDRPLACRIFPLFPVIDEKGRIFAEEDYRAVSLCPLIEHSDEVAFDPKFIRAVKKVGKILSKDKECRDFLYQVTEEIDTYRAFLSKDDN